MKKRNFRKFVFALSLLSLIFAGISGCVVYDDGYYGRGYYGGGYYGGGYYQPYYYRPYYYGHYYSHRYD
ncbi:MAG TPA: hypothetical protein VKH64_07925 [Candidatus Binatia bacterium]|nr:hypothetical protein [Candidatus Binatia bacterium]